MGWLMLYPVDDDNGRRGYVDAEGGLVVPMVYFPDGIMGYFHEGRALVCSPDTFRYGYIDLMGNLVISMQYRRAKDFDGDRAWVMDENERWGVIDSSGACITDFIFLEPEVFRMDSGRWICSPRDPDTGLFGVMDREGVVLLPFVFHHSVSFHEGLAPLQTDGLFGYVDISGNFLIDPAFPFAGPFSEGIAGVRFSRPTVWRDDPYSPRLALPRLAMAAPEPPSPSPRFIDRTGSTVFEHGFASVLPFCYGLAIVEAEDTGRLGFIDRTGTAVIQPRFKEVVHGGFFGSGVAFVLEKKRYELINRAGDRIERQGYSRVYYVTSFDDTLFCVYDQGLWGFVNSHGDWEIEPRFEDGTRFHHGLAEVNENLNGRLCRGYVNRTGEYVYRKAF